jgi:hypothetical protein
MLKPVTDRTTTWRHPEADQSPNAFLSSDDHTQEKIALRQLKRFSFKKNNKRALSHGKVPAEDQFQALAIVLTQPQPPRSRDDSEGGEAESNTRLSKDSTDSIQSHEPPSPTASSDKKRNVLRKMWNSSK